MRCGFVGLALMAGLCGPAFADEQSCTDQHLIAQAVDLANEGTSPLLGKVTVLDSPYNIRKNQNFGTSLNIADLSSILADREAQCAADVVTNRGKMTLYYGWETINEKGYVIIKMVPDMGEMPSPTPPPRPPAAAAPAPAPAPAVQASRWEDVLAQVKQHCAGEYADDFALQAYCVEQQRIGWEKLNAGEPVAPPAPAVVQHPASTPVPTTSPAPAATQDATVAAPIQTPALSAEQQATRLVFGYNADWSQDGTNIEGLAQYYAPQVTFYGTVVPREKVMDEKRKFSVRWPIRHYTVNPNSLLVQCGNDGACSVTGIVAWDCTSQERGEHSIGTANFAYRIVDGVIVSENGSVLTGHKDSAAQEQTVMTPAYAEGRRARIDYEQWVAGQQEGSYKAGVVFWSSHRSDKPQPPSCFSGGAAEWQGGCFAAKARLSPIDVRRTTEKDFWYGWNSL